MNSIKTDKSSLERRRPTFLKIGLIASLAFALMAFEYTTYGPAQIKFDPDIDVFTLEEEINAVKRIKEKIESTVEPDPKKEKKSTSQFEFAAVKEILKEETGIKDQPNEPVETKAGAKKELTLPIDPVETTDEPVDFLPIGSMPYYASCDLDNTPEERQHCTIVKFKRYVRDHMRIPSEFYGEEKAHVYFEVNKKGRIANVELLNKVDAGIEQELLRSFNQMPDLVPGHQRHKPVSVIYRMPIMVVRR